jgi:hypothetical protein
LHGQDESAAHSHQGNHRQRVNPDLKHLVNGCSPPMSISNQGQSRAHPTQGGPQLNVQAPNVVELTQSLSTGNFEKVGHQTASYPEWFISECPH